METKKEKLHKHYIVPIISAIVAGIIVAIVVSFFKITPLENKIQQQNTTIQNLENNAVSLESTIQVQKIAIEKLESNIVSLESTIQVQNTQIKQINQKNWNRSRNEF